MANQQSTRSSSKVTQPQNRVGIQVVRRLIQQHGICVGENTRQLRGDADHRQCGQRLGDTLRQVRLEVMTAASDSAT